MTFLWRRFLKRGRVVLALPTIVCAAVLGLGGCAAVANEGYHPGWAARASSVQPDEGSAAHAIDGKPETYWHTQYTPEALKHPHELIIDLGRTREIFGFVCLQRWRNPNGRIRDYEFHVSRRGKNWGEPAAKGRLTISPRPQTLRFEAPRKGRYVKLAALSEVCGRDFAALSEIDIITDLEDIPLQDIEGPPRPPRRETPRRARSIHLGYKAPDSTVFYNEITVDESHPGTYFCVTGFRHGYFGIQEIRSPEDKKVIFSIWDPGRQNDPNSVSDQERVKVLYEGEGVEVSRFGGEGTGGKSFFPYAWKIGETYRFAVRAEVEGDMTSYTGYFYLNEEKRWKRLVTFQTDTGGDYLKGHYAFVEDFRRNFTSYTHRRRARYGNGWVLTREGEWSPLTAARFTADDFPVMNIDAGVKDNRFFLWTGGEVENVTPL